MTFNRELWMIGIRCSVTSLNTKHFFITTWVTYNFKGVTGGKNCKKETKKQINFTLVSTCGFLSVKFCKLLLHSTKYENKQSSLKTKIPMATTPNKLLNFTHTYLETRPNRIGYNAMPTHCAWMADQFICGNIYVLCLQMY